MLFPREYPEYRRPRREPSRGGDRFYVFFLVLILLAGGGWWYLTTREQPATIPVLNTVLESAGLVERPAPVASQQEQRTALARFPQLGQPGSSLNQEFLARYENYRRENRSFFERPDWPTRLAEESTAALAAGKAPPPAPKAAGNYSGPTFADVLQPICDRVFSTKNLRDVVTSRIEIEECRKFFDSLAPGPVADSTRRLCVLLEASLTDGTMAAKRYERMTTALGPGTESGDFFGNQWMKPVAARRPSVNAELDKLRGLEASEARGYPASAQAGIAHLFEVQRIQALERSAVRIAGVVIQGLKEGALVFRGSGIIVFVAGLDSVVDNQQVNVLAHLDGIHRYKNARDEMRAVERFKFYRFASR